MSIFSSINIGIGKVVNTVNTIADLRNYKPRSIRDGDTVIVSAGENLGDAEGGAFDWVEGATVADDSSKTIKPVFAVGSGRWVKAFGKGDVGPIGPVSTEPGPVGPKGPQGDGLTTVMSPGGSALVGFKRVSAGAVSTSVEKTLNGLPMLATQFGAKFDGVTDDTVALQNAINAAHAEGRALLLPAGTACISAPLSIVGQAVSISGIANQTFIVATATMARMIDGQEADDSYYNPASIADLTLDGGSHCTDAIMYFRFRHHLLLKNIWTRNPGANAAHIRARDSWLCRYTNLRTVGGQTGFHAMGANHSSRWDACSFIGTTGDQLLIDNQAMVNDGNHGLTFVGCDVEFPNETTNAIGIRLKDNTSATFMGGYIGENFNYASIVNEGGVLDVYAAICFMGWQNKGVLCKPLGGFTRFHQCRIADQGAMGTYGCAGLTAAEAATATGKVSYHDMDLYTPLSSNHHIKGDVLGRTIKGPVIAKTIGSAYQGITNSTSVDTVKSKGDLTVTCSAVTGSSPLIGAYSVLKDADYIVGKPIYFAVVYKSSKPITATLTTGAFGAPVTIIETCPASPNYFTTTVNCLAIMNDGATAIQFYMDNAEVGDFITLRYVALSDGRVSTNNMTGGPDQLGLF